MYTKLGILTVVLPLLVASVQGHAGTQHTDAAACTQVMQGLYDASDFTKWAKDPAKAQALRAEFSAIEYFAGLVAVPLSEGASVEDTAAVHRDFEAAGVRFVEKANMLRIALPAREVRQYRQLTERCGAPYQR